LKQRRLSELDYVVFDTETTGLYADDGDEIIEIGAVRVKGMQITDEVFQSLINPNKPIPPASSEIHGIFDKDVKAAPVIDQMIDEFKAFCGSCIWVAQNARFDMSFLMKTFRKKAISVSNLMVLDTIGLSKILFPYETRHNLDVIMARLGIAKTGSRHRSVDDSRYTAQVLIEFIKLLEKQGVSQIQDVATALIKMESFHKKTQPKTQNLFG